VGGYAADRAPVPSEKNPHGQSDSNRPNDPVRSATSWRQDVARVVISCCERLVLSRNQKMRVIDAE
jgi:hypothetical protein